MCAVALRWRACSSRGGLQAAGSGAAGCRQCRVVCVACRSNRKPTESGPGQVTGSVRVKRLMVDFFREAGRQVLPNIETNVGGAPKISDGTKTNGASMELHLVAVWPQALAIASAPHRASGRKGCLQLLLFSVSV